MGKRFFPSMKWTCRVEFFDGSSESVTSENANERFVFLVSAYLENHSGQVRAIRLLDNRNVIYKEYHQNY